MSPTSQGDAETADPPLASSSVANIYDADSNRGPKRYLSDIPPTGKIDVNSSLEADFPIITDKGVDSFAKN